MQAEPTPAPGGDARVRWVYQPTGEVVNNRQRERWGVIQHAGGKDWVQTMSAQGRYQRFQLTEVERTSDYVELEQSNQQDKQVLRMYNTHLSVGPTRKQLRTAAKGSWEK